MDDYGTFRSVGEMSKMSSFPCCRLMGPAQRPCLPSVLAKIQISAAELKNQQRIKKKIRNSSGSIPVNPNLS